MSIFSIHKKFVLQHQNPDAIQIAKQRLSTCDQSVSSHKQSFIIREIFSEIAIFGYECINIILF